MIRKDVVKKSLSMPGDSRKNRTETEGTETDGARNERHIRRQGCRRHLALILRGRWAASLSLVTAIHVSFGHTRSVLGHWIRR